MKQLFFMLSSVLLLTLSSANLSAQTDNDLPGSDVINSLYPELFLNSAEGMRLCCFAAYGWHYAPDLKIAPTTQPLPGEGDDIAKRLISAGITSQLEEQFFTIEDEGYIVVSKIDTFEKVLSRYIINANSKKK
jgi:hypothetical protein